MSLYLLAKIDLNPSLENPPFQIRTENLYEFFVYFSCQKFSSEKKEKYYKKFSMFFLLKIGISHLTWNLIPQPLKKRSKIMFFLCSYSFYLQKVSDMLSLSSSQWKREFQDPTTCPRQSRLTFLILGKMQK